MADQDMSAQGHPDSGCIAALLAAYMQLYG